MWYNRGNIWFWQFSKLLKIGGGAHYYWPAATAGSGYYQVNGGNVQSSICPAGWRLPYGNTSTATSGSSNYAPWGFGNLILAEGIIGSAITTYVDFNQSDKISYLTGYTSTPSGNTMSFLRSGYYIPGNRRIDNRNVNIGYWSSGAKELTTAYSFGTAGTYFYPGFGTFSKGHGLAIRCVAN